MLMKQASGQRITRTRALLPCALLLVSALILLGIPENAYAQYRGGRKPPEPVLKRKGLLFVEGTVFKASPKRDFASSTGGAASTGTGWRIGIGTWFLKRYSGEFEYGVMNNDRYSNLDPWSNQRWPNVTEMGFRTYYFQGLLRINLVPDRRFIPFVLLGLGKVHSVFTVYFADDAGQPQSVSRRGDAVMLTAGLGVGLVVASHATIVAELRTMEWFGSWIIPGGRYWSVRRLGLGMGWHF